MSLSSKLYLPQQKENKGELDHKMCVFLDQLVSMSLQSDTSGEKTTSPSTGLQQRQRTRTGDKKRQRTYLNCPINDGPSYRLHVSMKDVRIKEVVAAVGKILSRIIQELAYNENHVWQRREL